MSQTAAGPSSAPRSRVSVALMRPIIFFGAIAAALTIVILLRGIFLPLLLGLGIAYILDPAVTWFERRGRSRVVGVVVVAVVLLLLIAGFILYLVPAVGAQAAALRERLPVYRGLLERQLQPLLERIQAQYPTQLAEIQQRAVDTLREKWPQMASSAIGWLGGVFGSVVGFLVFLLSLIFVPVFAFYLLVDFPKLKRAATDLIPLPYRPLVLERMAEVDQAVSSFMRGQLTIALILAAINALGLTLLQVPLGIAIGIFAGLANMIPYMALVVGLAPALLLAWVEHQSWGVVLGVVGVFAGAQMLEGTVLSPRILGKSVNLHAVWVLLAIIIGGELFGFVGMLVAVPTAASVQVFLRHWLEAYRRSVVYRGDEITPPAPDSGRGSPI